MNFIKDFPDHSYMKLVSKKVKITCIDGDELIGTVLGFESALNNYMGAASIELDCEKFPHSATVVSETEIESIDLI